MSFFSNALVTPLVSAWVGEEVVVLSNQRTDQAFTHEKNCPGYSSFFQIGSNYEQKKGCMYGKAGGFRFVRYLNNSSFIRYGFSRPNESVFRPVTGVCEGTSGCVYSQQTDTLLMQRTLAPNGSTHVMVTDFSKRLHLDGTNTFRFDPPESTKVIGRGSIMHPTGAVGISSNGMWAVVELHDYGFVKINLTDGTMRRIIAPGATYGMGRDPGYELTISNSGQYVVVVGSRAGLGIYEVSDTCGDILTESSLKQFDSLVKPCSQVSTDRFQLFPGFLSAHIPRFADNGRKLSLYISASYSQSLVTLAPKAEISASTNAYYRAFGDSFTSGEGEHSDAFYKEGTNNASNRCHVSIRSYPYLLGNEWGTVAENMSCSGSTMQNVRETYKKLIDTGDRIGTPVGSVSIGGNDINLMSKLKTCLGLDTCEWALAGNRLASAHEIQSLLPRAVEFITELKRTYPETNWFIVGYPLVINATDVARCTSLVAAALDREERVYMEESVKLLNVVLRAAAHSTYTQYVDIEASLEGERLCDPIEKSMNAIRFGNDIAPISLLKDFKVIGAESFHPTPEGHQRIFNAIHSQLSGYWEIVGCGQCNPSFEMRSYWNQPHENSNLLKQIAQKFIQVKEVISGMSIPYSFPAGSFKPDSLVRFEIHSTPVHLETVAANPDGSLDGYLKLPDGINGYHTIHAYGQDEYDTNVDIYEIRSISQESPAQPNDKAALTSFSSEMPNQVNQENDANNVNQVGSLATSEATRTHLTGIENTRWVETDIEADISKIEVLSWAWYGVPIITALILMVIGVLVWSRAIKRE